jgi:hypothetical protein
MRVRAADLLPLLLLLAIVRLWLMPLRSSFWVDEMGTVFVVQHGADHPSFAVAPQVPASIYYYLPRLSQALGQSEVAYRIPSVLLMAAVLWTISRLAKELIHPNAAWLAVFACLSLNGFDYQAADARPYALGTLVACGGLWCEVKWLDSGRWRLALGFMLCAALLWRVQLIFWPFYLVFAGYAAVRLWQRDTPVSWTRVLLVFAAGGLALLPVVTQALALYREAHAHVIAKLPPARDLLYALKVGMVLSWAGVCWLLGREFGWKGEARMKPSSRALILLWWLVHPVALFAFSWVTGNSVFVTRYLWVALPGAVLAMLALVRRFLPATHWKTAAAFVAIGVIAYDGQWERLWPWHHNSDWRSAARAERQSAADTTPVLCPSPFIEAKWPVWRPDYPLPGFLYAHLPVYPVRGRKFLFPFESSPEAEAYARKLEAEVFPAAHRFLIYGGAGQTRDWKEWFEKQPAMNGWSARNLGPFGDVNVVEFEMK